ncbi:unnamed protein product [Closterium sp. NIES-54]
MALLRVLAFDHEGRPIQFDTWLDDLQLYLLSDSRDSVSLFDHTSGAAPAPPATAGSATRSQWLTRDAAARLAIRNHLPLAECDHFGQALYDAVVAHYSSPAAAALGRSARGTPRTPFFEGCSTPPPCPLLRLYCCCCVLGAEDVGAASASVKRRNSKGKGGRGGGAGSGSGGGSSSGGSGGNGGGGSGGSGGGSGGVGGGSGGSGGSGSGGSGGGRTGAQRGGSGGGQRQRQQRRSKTPSPQQLREWLFQRGASGGSTCGKPHTQHRSRLDDAWRAEFGDEVERPHWAELFRSGVAIFDLDYDASLSALYALSASAEGDCCRCVPPDPGIEAAALGASESSLPGTAPADALHTFRLDSGASRCFFRENTTLTPLPAHVSVRLADPSGAPVVARSSTILPCPAVSSGSVSSPPLVLYKLGEYRCPSGFDGHYHHSWGSACVDLHVYTDGSSPGHVHSSARFESVHTGYRAS